MLTPGEDSCKYLLPLESARELVAELRGVPPEEVHLRGLIGDRCDADEAWGYADLLSDASLGTWERQGRAASCCVQLSCV